MILNFCKEPHSIQEIMKLVGLNDKSKFRNKHIKPLMEGGLLEMTIPEKPNSSKQKYIATDM